VSVATELVVKPSVLFLDEPTSGLDATTAKALIVTLKNLSMNGGHSIAVVIHQPRTEIYHMFDHLLLLRRGGQVVFDGPANMARQYLESIPTVDKLPPETGIADWMMDIVIDDQKQKLNQEYGSDELSLSSYWKKRRDDQMNLFQTQLSN